ncbi:hypothetical protein PDG61_28490 [Mycolicibacterium sp. BiH015]|uniref:hypothetical protein n=1 Tax=Mycolicibacterium sp. BiH015 TaxID=3018808 RepID=UPI0022E05D4E|nr:hypothetical protein [Mycolicibacterium sp. BiH015]MDA2894882.1 hypothetical protein [Mycolicibacterium sp. BiH015]
MSAPAKIAAFVAMLAVVFAGALWLGTQFGPDADVAIPHPATSEHPHPPLDGG